MPFDLIYQGYIYADTIINHGGISNGTSISGLVAINNGGNLCFWFPSQGYWHGYNVKVYTAYATRATNRVTSITGVAKPTTAKEVALSANIRQSLHSSNYTSYAPSLTGSGASGTWGINVTGTSGSISGFNNPTTAATANTIAYRNGDGDIAAREIILSSGLSSSQPTVLVSMFPTTNQLVRTEPSAVANAIRDAASGTWGINVTGNAATVTNGVYTSDNVVVSRGSLGDPADWNAITTAGVYTIAAGSLTGANNPGGYPYGTLYVFTDGARVTQFYTRHSSTSQTSVRNKFNASDWQPWANLLSALDYTSYAPSLTGSGASGTWSINVTGNAATATSATSASSATTLTGLTSTVAELNFVDGVTSNIQTQLNAKANLASPALTGTPTAPTAPVGTNTTQLATTAFVNAEIANDAPTKTGGGASGTWAISISGNAATATSATDSTKLPLTGGTVTGDITMSGTGMIKVPVGTTAQRPGSPAVGMIRYNSTRGCYEGYTPSGWVNMSATLFDSLGSTT